MKNVPHPNDLNLRNPKQIRYIDLSYNKISSLEGLEQFANVETLILDCNYIGDNIHIPNLPALTTLSLNKNQVGWCVVLYYVQSL